MSDLNMSDPMPDIPLLRKAAEWVETQATLPESEREWDQRMWRITPDMRAARYAYLEQKSCGTTYCVAGKVCDDAGIEWDSTCGGSLGDSNDTAARLATQVLGLTEDEADWLFNASNTAADVREVAESIAARVGERL